MAINSFTPNLININNVRFNDEMDEFFRQILEKCITVNDVLLGGSTTKPIFRNSKVIQVSEDLMFYNQDNNNLEVLISFDRDRAYDITENECVNPLEVAYIVYVRLEMNKNNRNRLTRVLDRLTWLLTKNDLSGNNGYIESIINTDINNTDPNSGRKYFTNLNLLNRVAEGSGFELTESLNERNYYTGGFTVLMTIGW